MGRFFGYFFSIICFLIGVAFFIGGPISCIVSSSTGWGIGGLIIGIALIALGYTIRPRH